jgi:hypothetical protein
MGDDNPLATFGYVVEQLDQRNVALSLVNMKLKIVLPNSPKFKGVDCQ